MACTQSVNVLEGALYTLRVVAPGEIFKVCVKGSVAKETHTFCLASRFYTPRSVRVADYTRVIGVCGEC